MSNDPNPNSDPRPDARRQTFNDVRDDFDDDFGRALSPREAARRMVLGPAIAFILIGVLGILGMIVAETALLVENLDRALNGRSRHVFNLTLGTFGVLLAMVLFGMVIAGGVNMMRLQRRWLSLFAAYVVTGLALAGCYAILFFPFGVWGLVVLYRPDAREQFGRSPPPRDDGHGEL
jgi:hypothetical protein